MATALKIGDAFEFRRPYEIDRYGRTGRIDKIENVYPSVAHPGPAFVTWIKMTSENGTKIERTLGEFNRTCRAIPAPPP